MRSLAKEPARVFGWTAGACLALTAAALGDDGGLKLPGISEAAPRGTGADAANTDLSAPLRTDSGFAISSGTKYYFRIAGWYTALDANLTYGDSVNLGTVDLDFDRVLGYDMDLLTLRGAFGFSIADKFHLDFGINGPLNYDGRLTQDASFDNLLFSANSSSELDMIGLDADFSWDFVRKEKIRVALVGGIRAALFHFEIEGQATDRNGNVIASQREELDAGAAIPVVGLSSRWDFSRNFYLSGKAVGLYAGDYGNAYDLYAEVGWDFTRNFGAYAGFRYTHFEASNIDIDDVDLEFDYSLYGPYVGIEVRF